MTVPAYAPNSYVGDNTLAIYPYAFQIYQNADLLVQQISTAGVITTLTLTTDYTISGVLNPTGGNVTLTAGNLATGVSLMISVNPSIVQSILYQEGGVYSAATIMQSLDLLTKITQRLSNQATRSFHVPANESPTDVQFTLPPAALRANMNLGFDGSGLPSISTTLTGATVSGAMIPVVTAATLLAARTALGLSISGPGKVLGRTTAGAGPYEELSAGAGINISGGLITNTGSAPSGSITASGYTQSTGKILGRTTAATGAIEELSAGSGISISGGQISNTGTSPTGTVVAWAGPDASPTPTGWLECNGAAVSRTTYATLFALISTLYGVGDGSTTFNVPQTQRQVIMGRGGTAVNGPANTTGAQGGAESQTLTTANLASHAHQQQFVNAASTPQTTTVAIKYSSAGVDNPSLTTMVGTATTPANVNSLASTPLNTVTAGSGTGHNNVQPSLVLRYIIAV